MKYITPEVELKVLMAMDVITSSNSNNGGVDEGGNYVPPTDEF